MPQRRIGILVGREWSWPPAFIDEVNRRDVGVTAEFVKLGAPPLDEAISWDVVVDRLSHEVPFYRTWLKHAALRGVTVINNPFMWTADDKYFGATLAEANGVRSPRTMALPNKDYVPGITHDESLRNLVHRRVLVPSGVTFTARPNDTRRERVQRFNDILAYVFNAKSARDPLQAALNDYCQDHHHQHNSRGVPQQQPGAWYLTGGRFFILRFRSSMGCR